MANRKKEVTEPLVVTVGGEEHRGHVVISGTRKLQFVVHYGNLSQGDGRDYGVTPTERKDLKTMAEAMLIQLVSTAKRPARSMGRNSG